MKANQAFVLDILMDVLTLMIWMISQDKRNVGKEKSIAIKIDNGKVDKLFLNRSSVIGLGFKAKNIPSNVW